MADSEEPCTSTQALALQRFQNLSLEGLDKEEEIFSDMDEDDLLHIVKDEDDLLRIDVSEDDLIPEVDQQASKRRKTEKTAETSGSLDLVSMEIGLVEAPEKLERKKKKKSNRKRSKRAEKKETVVLPKVFRNPEIEQVRRVNLMDILDEKPYDDYADKDCFYSPKTTEDPVEQILEDLANVYRSERSRVIGKDGFISTPLHALKTYALKYDLQIHNEFVVIPHAASGRSTVRVEIAMGGYRGVGEAFKGRQAAQMASLDILMKIQESQYPDPVIPYTLCPGWRVKSRVIRDLTDICRTHNLKTPKFYMKWNNEQPDVPLYTVECSIGGNVIAEGSGDQPFIAKKLAAYEAVVAITGTRLPQEFVALGEACTPLDELKEKGYKPRFPEPALHSSFNEMHTPEEKMDEGDADLFNLKPLKVTVSQGSATRRVFMHGQ